jgi:hypothetical protein
MMKNGNFVSIQLSADELQRTQVALDELKAVLGSKLSSLGNGQRRKYASMGDGSEPFVEKVIDFARTNPEFLPGFVEVESMQVDFQAVRDLNSIFRPLQQIMRQLDDSILLSGNEAFTAARAYYHNVKRAAQQGIPGAVPIYEELRPRFSRNGNRKTDDNEDHSG